MLFPNTTYNSREVCGAPACQRAIDVTPCQGKSDLVEAKIESSTWSGLSSLLVNKMDALFLLCLWQCTLSTSQTSVSIYRHLMLMKLKSSQGFTEFEGKLVICFTGLLLCPWDLDWYIRARNCLMHKLASVDLTRAGPMKELISQ